MQQQEGAQDHYSRKVTDLLHDISCATGRSKASALALNRVQHRMVEGRERSIHGSRDV